MFRKFFKWIKELFVRTVEEITKEIDWVDLAEISLLSNPKLSATDRTILREAIVIIKAGNVEEIVVKEAKKRLKEVLMKYKENARGYLNSDPRD